MSGPIVAVPDRSQLRSGADCTVLPKQCDAVITILATLRATIVGHQPFVQGGTADQAARLIDDPKYAGRIIVVDAMDGGNKVISHAEQNLVCATLWVPIIHPCRSGCVGGVGVADPRS